MTHDEQFGQAFARNVPEPAPMDAGLWHNAQYYGGWRYWPALKVMLCEHCAGKTEDEVRQMVEARAC